MPILGKIPLVGALFRSTATKASKRNLMLFIRPTIIRSTEGSPAEPTQVEASSTPSSRTIVS